MKKSLAVLALVLFGAYSVFAGEYKRRDACESIPRWALERAEKALRLTHPEWEVIPVIGGNGEWRCKTNGAYVRKYDKTLFGERMDSNIALFVDKDGSIFMCDNDGCFSLDRWK